MDYLKIVFAAFGSIVILFFSTKIIGNKQMSELSMFDYINGITIGSIAAEMATSLENILNSVIAMGVYTAVIAVIAVITRKSIVLRRFFTGRSIVLMQDGKIYKDNFKTAKIDLNDFLVQCRANGFFNVSDIETAMIEENGKISFLPKTAARPVNTKDLNLLIKEEHTPVTVIIDGKLLSENLTAAGCDEKWLSGELQRLNLSTDEIFLGICDDKKLTAYKKITEAPKNDISQ